MYPVQALLSDVIIGEFGQTIKNLFQKTNCYVFVPAKEVNGERIFQLSGTHESIDRCKLELQMIIK